MTDAAKEARNAYRRDWAKRNPEKIKRYQANYWAKQAEGAGSSLPEDTKKNNRKG